MRDGELFAGGLNLDFYPSAEFEADNTDDSIENYRSKARNLLRILMMGWTESWRNLLSWQTFQAVFSARDHQLTQAMRYAFQEGFDHIFEQLNTRQLAGHPLTVLEKNQAFLYISNCIAYLPYADLSPYESIAIPQYVGDRWQKVDYKVVPIELTPTWGFKKLFLADHDRVFAYGLEPINNADAEPHLVFMGTTYPAGQGFATTVNTDLEPFETAGKKLYRSGHRNITRWLDQQTKKAHVCGTSLGGALSLLLAIDQGNKLSRVDALNPPGLYQPWRKSRFDHWDEFDDADKPAVYIQENEGDPVSYFGIKKEDWHILRVKPPADKRGPNPVAAHALNYAGFAETQVVGVDTAIDNESRKMRNWWIYSVLRSAFYYFILVPIRFLVVQPLRFVFSHKIQLLMTLAFAVLFNVYPVPFLGFSLSLAINTILPAMITGYLLATIAHYAAELYTNKRDSNLAKFLDLLAESPLLKITVGLLAAAMTASIVTSFLIVPALLSTLMLSFASIPSVIAIIDSIINTVQILFGFNNVQAPMFHDPELERNANLDMYENETEVTYTYEQMKRYYQANRSLKGKAFLPDEREQGQTFKGTEFTKRAVLERSQDPTSHQETITFFATKAKIHHMNSTLRLLDTEYESELEQNQQDYATGKTPGD